MANGPLSSVMLIAGDGLLQNQGLEIAGNLIISVDAYTSVSVVSSFIDLYGNAVVANVLLPNTLDSLKTISANNFPALTDVISANLTANIANVYGNTVGNVYGNSTTWFTDIVISQANRLIGNIYGNIDLSIFAQIYNSSQGYKLSANQMMKSARNSDVLDATFINMDALTTGGISLMTNDTQLFGKDLIALGTTINLSKLNFLGHPWVLLLQMIKAGGLLPEVATALSGHGITSTDLASIQVNDATVAGDLDLDIYHSLMTITGDTLKQVEELLDVTTPGLITAADLLNPKMMLPNSYKSLVVQLPTESTQVTLYNSNGSLNTVVSNYFKDDPEFVALSKIIPADQAAVNVAWARGFLQVKNISNLTLPDFAKATSLVESNAGLSTINALTTPVPTTVQGNIISKLAPVPGLGPDGTFTLYDFVGTLAGYPYVAEFDNVVGNLNIIYNAGNLNPLLNTSNGLYPTMANCIAGVYTQQVEIDPGPPPVYANIVVIPSGLPGAGTYSSVDDAFASGLIPAGSNLIANIVANNSSWVANTSTSYGNMVMQIEREDINLSLAQVDFGNIQGNSSSAVMGLVEDLHTIGTQIAPKEANDLFVAIANTQTQTGQAVIASLREGRNIQAMEAAGIGVDTQLNPN